VDDLRLPGKNEFIPSKLALKERVDKPSVIPSVLKETPLSRVWFLQDSEFLLPKAIVSLEMFRSEVTDTVAVLTLALKKLLTF